MGIKVVDGIKDASQLTFRWEDYSGLSRRAQRDHKCPSKCKREAGGTESGRWQRANNSVQHGWFWRQRRGPPAKECWQPPELGRVQEWNLPENLQGECSLATPLISAQWNWYWNPSLQDCERIHFCGFKPGSDLLCQPQGTNTMRIVTSYAASFILRTHIMI